MKQYNRNIEFFLWSILLIWDKWITKKLTTEQLYNSIFLSASKLRKIHSWWIHLFTVSADKYIFLLLQRFNRKSPLLKLWHAVSLGISHMELPHFSWDRSVLFPFLISKLSRLIDSAYLKHLLQLCRIREAWIISQSVTDGLSLVLSKYLHARSKWKSIFKSLKSRSITVWMSKYWICTV